MPVDACVPWDGEVNKKGHGYFWNGETTVMAHRDAYEAKHGPLPAGIEVHHECLNPGCVNVGHLKPLSRTKHRQIHRRLRGRYHCSKISDADISSARMLRDELRPKQAEQARVYGVSQSNISRAISGVRRRGLLQPSQ